MKDKNAKKYIQTMHIIIKLYDDYLNDILSVTSFKKSSALLLIKIFAVHLRTKNFFKILHENNYLIPTNEKWSRNKFASCAMSNDILLKDEFNTIKNEIDKELVTSITKAKYINRIKIMAVKARLKNRISLEEIGSEDNESKQSIKKITFNEDFLNYFNNNIESGEIKLFINLLIPEKKLNQQLASDVFRELLNIVNKKSKLSAQEIKVAIFLQNLLLTYLPNVLFMSQMKSDCWSLIWFRKHTNKKYNSICPNCYKPLLKRSNVLLCSHNENASCYKKTKNKKYYTLKQKEKKQTKCCNCHLTSKILIAHKVKKKKLFFCSDRCYRTYIKRIQRQK